MPNAQSRLQRARKTLVGDRAFYTMVLAIVVPIIVQNAITNFVSLLDNIMVGQVGTNQMAGVSVVNQLLFVSNLCVFGGMSGAGIFSAQYYGAKKHDGVRYCFRYKLYLSIILTAAALLIFGIFGRSLVSLYLNDTEDPERVALTLNYGMDYLGIMLWGIAPFALAQTYASTLREGGETRLPMAASIAAVCINLTLNYILIYGKLGAPTMGVKGAALATVISRYAELSILLIAVHAHSERYPFIQGAYRSLKIPIPLVKDITIKGMPLLVNELLWSLGVAMISQSYSLRGLDVVAALNISNTVSNLFNVVSLSMGSAISVIIGQVLGAGEVKKAKDYAWKLTAFGMALSIVTGIVLAIASPFIPHIYNTEAAIRQLATQFLLVYAVCMPLFSFTNSCYFILRSGGKTIITFLFDCVFSWVISLPLAYTLVQFTGLNIVMVYFFVQLADLIKCILGFIMVKKGIWIQNIVTGT